MAFSPKSPTAKEQAQSNFLDMKANDYDKAAERDGLDPDHAEGTVEAQGSTKGLAVQDDDGKGEESPTKKTPQGLVIKKKKGPRLCINTFNTQYPIITEASKAVGYRCKQADPNLYINPYQQMDGSNPNNTIPAPEEFDVCWFDLAINPEILYRVKTYQRVS